MVKSRVNDLPKISIVTPSFNQVQFIEATIQSVLSQNYPNLEYIIIDGGSTDGSLEIIKKYEKHLYFWCSEPDEGQYDAINKGFAKSTGEIMAWLNSDDMYCPWAFKTVASIFSELSQVEWLTTLNPVVWDWHGFLTGLKAIPGYSREAFLDGRYIPFSQEAIGYIQQESTFWKRNLWEKVNSCVSNKFKLAGDFDLWCRFYTHTDLYGTVSPLGGFRLQANQKSRSAKQYLMEAENSLRDMRNLCQWQPKISRNIAFYSSLYRIPKVRQLIESMYGYTTKNIVRKKEKSPQSYWVVKESNFFGFPGSLYR